MWPALRRRRSGSNPRRDVPRSLRSDRRSFGIGVRLRARPFAAMRLGGGGGSASPFARSAIVPTIAFHGDADKTVSPVNGDQVIAQATPAASLETTVVRGKTADGVSYICTIQSDATGRSMLEQWVLHGVGHAWSGGSPAGSYSDAGGPDASREMVRFFLQHSTVT